MFRSSSFNGDLSKWEVSSVTDMSGMFASSSFNGDLSKWDVSSVTDMTRMFRSSSFNGDLSKWDVSSVTNMSRMLARTSFNGDLSKWDVSSVTHMSGMFDGCPVCFEAVWEQRKQRWVRRKAWVMVISPFLKGGDVVIEGPLQMLLDIQGIPQLIASFL
jgi:surface protein